MKTPYIMGFEFPKPQAVIDHLYEVKLTNGEDNTEAFRMLRETLERIGVISRTEYNTLYPSCYVIFKHGKYYIAHHNILDILDGKPNVITREQVKMQHKIIKWLLSWGRIVECPKFTENVDCDIMNDNIIALKHAELPSWSIKHQYIFKSKS